MFGIGGGEFVIIALVALFVFGPDRLPGAVKSAARMLNDVRRWTTKARADLTDTLGPEFENFDLADLNPKNFVRKHLLEGLDDVDEDEVERRRAARRTAAATAGADEPSGATALAALEGSAPVEAPAAATTDDELEGSATRIDTLALTESAGGGPDPADPVLVGAAAPGDQPTRRATPHVDFDAT